MSNGPRLKSTVKKGWRSAGCGRWVPGTRVGGASDKGPSTDSRRRVVWNDIRRRRARRLPCCYHLVAHSPMSSCDCMLRRSPMTGSASNQAGDDLVLIEALRRGDEAAFVALVGRYHVSL